MNIIHARLHTIEPNPYQPRESEDLAHVKNVALSIAAEGLLSPPLARIVTSSGFPIEDSADRLRANSIDEMIADGYRLQLVFGHTRLAAFKWLIAIKDHSNLNANFSRIPLIISDLTDEEMFRRGLSENLARKDLNPIEEAKAMLVYRERFKKTSTEIGQLFHLSDSAVRNKLRLLNLPKPLQDDLRACAITEGVGRALVPLYDLPEAVRIKSEDDGDELKPSEIIEAARSGISPERVSEMVARLTRRLNPQPEQAAIATPIPIVAENDAVEDNKVELENVSMETVQEPARQPVQPIRPAPAPIPSLQPAAPPTPPPAQPPAPHSPLATHASPQPSPTPAIDLSTSWDKSTIQLSLTICPADPSGNRMVNIGGRINQDAPVMSFARLADLALPAQLESILTRLHTEK